MPCWGCATFDMLKFRLTRRALPWLLVVAAVVAAPFVAPWITDANRDARLEAEHRDLFFQYVDPQYSLEFCRYWEIDDLAVHKRALMQQYLIASSEAMDVSYGESESELLRFHRQRMILWLKERLLERTEHGLMFRRRGDEPMGSYSLGLRLGDAEMDAIVPR